MVSQRGEHVSSFIKTRLYLSDLVLGDSSRFVAEADIIFTVWHLITRQLQTISKMTLPRKERVLVVILAGSLCDLAVPV